MSKTSKPSYFTRSYQIHPGGKFEPMNGFVFDLTISGNPDSNTIVGYGNIRQMEGPTNIPTRLEGTFSRQCVVWNNQVNCRNYISANGYPPYILPLGNNVSEPENVRLSMSLDDDWQNGVAKYSFKDDKGNWVTLADQTVTSVPINESLPESKESAVEA